MSILRKADENGPQGGLSEEATAIAVEVSIATVQRVRRSFVEAGLPAALERKAPDRQYVRRAARRLRPLDAAPLGRPAGGTGGRGIGLP